MKTNLFLSINLYLLLATLIIITGCPCDVFNDDSGTLSGQVTNVDKYPLVDVKVTIGDKTVYSDENGLFSIGELEIGDEQLVEFSKPNYISNQKVVDISVDEISYVFAALGTWQKNEIIDPTQSNSIHFQNAKVDLNANSIVDENGIPFTGNVKVLASYFDPMSDNYENVFPGDFQGENADGMDVDIESFGFIAVELKDGDKNLNLASGSNAIISIPITNELKGNAPAEIPLWYFDEEIGTWIEEGSAINQNGVYVGSVSHFTAWNVDMEFSSSTISGRVIDQHGNPIVGARVLTKGVNYSGSTSTYTDSNGNYEVIVKSNANAKIYASVISTAGLETASSQVIVTSTAGNGSNKTIAHLVIDLSGSNASTILYGINSDLSTAWAVGENGSIFYYDSLWLNKPSGIAETLYDIDCPVYDNFWIVGANGTVLRSTDFGESWSNISIGTTKNLYNVDFPNGFHGCIVGESGTIYMTNDGGEIWNSISSSTIQDLQDVYFVNQNEGWICGNSGTILHSIDGGNTWQSQNSGTAENLNGIEFTDRDKGWAVGDKGVIVRTMDGGQSWTVETSGTSEDLNDIDFAHYLSGCIVGDGGTHLKSTDKGENWMIETVQLNNNLEAVSLNGYGEGFVVGDDNNFKVSVGNLPVSVGWNLQNSGITEVLLDVEAVSETKAWAVGHRGSIIKTANAGNNWSKITSLNTLNYDLYTVEVIGSNIWVGGEYKMWKSLDNGATWNEINSDYSKVFLDVQFTDPLNGWCLTHDDGNYTSRELFKTIDGGLNWTLVTNLPYGSQSYFPGFTFIDVNNGCVLDFDNVRETYSVFQTKDGGSSWTVSDLQYTNNTALYAWQAGISYTIDCISVYSPGWFHQSKNGEKWFSQKTSSHLVTVIEFVNSETGWILDYHTLKKTTNGGQSWHTEGGNSFSIFGSADIDMVNESVGWAVKNTGEIYYTTTGGE